jgi:hypothetical protein
VPFLWPEIFEPEVGRGRPLTSEALFVLLPSLKVRGQICFYYHGERRLYYIITIISSGRSQRPCGLRHEPSSPARTQGSWVGIPLEAWMSVCVYFVFMLFCV